MLGLDSAYERIHPVFSFLILAYLSQHDDFQFHPFSCKWHNFILLYSWIYSIVYIYHIFFICSLADRHLVRFCSLAKWIVLLWTWVQVSLLHAVLQFFGLCPGVAQQDHTFSRNLHGGCTSLHSHQQHRKGPFSPHPHQHLVLFVCLKIAIRTRVKSSKPFLI
jgi:hypothetical protein